MRKFFSMGRKTGSIFATALTIKQRVIDNNKPVLYAGDIEKLKKCLEFNKLLSAVKIEKQENKLHKISSINHETKL